MVGVVFAETEGAFEALWDGLVQLEIHEINAANIHSVRGTGAPALKE